MPDMPFPSLYSLMRRALFILPPEAAHRLTLKVLQTAPLPACRREDEILRVDCLGLQFSNPLGLAAGFDKNAEVPLQMLRLGFGFVEVGGVTPRAQTGNPQPRVFRLEHDEALINRLGFNNEGMTAIAQRLSALQKIPGIIGINLGANKDNEDKAADYVALLQNFNGLADFMTLNVSSPNTPGLRNFQNRVELDALLSRLSETRAHIVTRQGSAVPLLLKIAPDVTLPVLDDIAALSAKHKIDAIIMGNTTLSRPRLSDHEKSIEPGGLSGKPLFPLSTHRLAQLRQRVGKEMILIGVGGIDSADAAYAKICAGANLLQLYTGLIYHGPSLINEIKTGLADRLRKNGFARIADAVGSRAVDFAREG